MALINKIVKVTESKDISDENIYGLTKGVLLNHKKKNENRKTYKLVFTNNIRNKNQLKRCIFIDGFSDRCIDGKIFNALKYGFKPSNECKELTRQIASLLMIDENELVVDFEL